MQENSIKKPKCAMLTDPGLSALVSTDLHSVLVLVSYNLSSVFRPGISILQIV